MFNQVRSLCKTCKHKTICNKIILRNIFRLKASFIIQNALIFGTAVTFSQLLSWFFGYNCLVVVTDFCFLSLACTIN